VDFQTLQKQLETANTTELLDLLLQGAVALNASDIHFEPQENVLRIRFRIDGVLQEIGRLPLENYKGLLSRVKFLAKMGLNVNNMPQDGRFTKEVLGRHFDFRCATLPTVYGENVVIRLLEQEAKFYTLTQLGFRQDLIEKLSNVAKRPQGMILNTGPTGSGKTTTLYAILAELNRPQVKIITLEDPIEYRIEGIAQSQVDTERGFGFAEALKGSLRSDPDIIMVGEIRDAETANIALQAALTGHLVLSTFHSLDAASSLVRLVEIGIHPYLLSGSINAVIAQRLVRKICTACKETYKIDKTMFNYLKTKLPQYRIPNVLSRGKGCPACAGTGYKGRSAIGEILIPTPEIEDLIIRHTSLAQVTELARRQEGLTLEQDGLLKAISGITTLEEVFRVARE
jgi:type II secretory ATPase GspE/PulE/Tfp pilus assembly ATPase PilB-like protein